jgi:hypothetical protein
MANRQHLTSGKVSTTKKSLGLHFFLFFLSFFSFKSYTCHPEQGELAYPCWILSTQPSLLCIQATGSPSLVQLAKDRLSFP